MGDADVLEHRDGHRVRFVEEGVDADGEYLLIEHFWPRPGMMAGPHWHPVLAETFAVEEGKVRFRVDGREFVLGPGETATVRPGEVHGFWNEGEETLLMMHRVSPPGRHREMFELWHRLDAAGKTNRQGVPTNPLALGLIWERQDGYVAGLPESLQSLVFGGLARLARLVGYEARWSTGTRATRSVGSERPSRLRSRPTGALRFVLRLPVYLYRLRLGRLLGHRFLLLTHRGRRSGRVYRTVLEVIRYEPSTREIVTVSGRGERADWYRNIGAQPALELQSGSDRYAPEQRFLTPDEVYREIVDYERRHPWAVRVVPPLLGFRLDGSEPARRAFAESLRMVAFRP
jgi:deazaflavin-dependent oxidoreductase (nitroreductase family)